MILENGIYIETVLPQLGKSQGHLMITAEGMAEYCCCSPGIMRL